MLAGLRARAARVCWCKCTGCTAEKLSGSLLTNHLDINESNLCQEGTGSIRFVSVPEFSKICRFASLRFGKLVVPVRRGSACVLRTRRGSVRFGSVRPVRFGFLNIYLYIHTIYYIIVYDHIISYYIYIHTHICIHTIYICIYIYIYIHIHLFGGVIPSCCVLLQ